MDITQPPLLYILIAVAVLLVAFAIAAAVRSARHRRERQELQQRYGAEYDRTVERHRNTRGAVADLKEREQQREELQLHDLNDADLTLVRKNLAIAQFRFVEDPTDALRQTEQIMTEVLRAKGYPVDDRDNAARLFSVDHPEHAETVRTTLEPTQTSDVEHLRERFLQARKTIADITGTKFGPEDAGHAVDAGDDLRVEHNTSV